MESFWISIKSFVVTVLLLGSAVLVVGDGDCTYPKNPSKLNNKTSRQLHTHVGR